MKQLLAICLLFWLGITSVSGFDLQPYTIERVASFSPDVFYPELFRQTDPITLGNIIAEFKFRYEYFAGISSEQRFKACFKLQNRINKWLEKISSEKNSIPYKWVDDELLFNDESPLRAKIRPLVTKPDDSCSFTSFGELGHGGGVFCKFHGPDPQSDFYQRHIHRFIEARPFVTAYDITEILIFLPFMIVIPISWLIMKKILGNKDTAKG